MKVLFIVPYPLGEAPSQRFRFEQYLDILSRENIHWAFRSFYSPAAWKIIYQKGRSISKLYYVFSGMLRRTWQMVFQVPRYQVIFIHREATPLGPPWFEWVAAKILNKKIIYDFDDSIWLRDKPDVNRGVQWFKSRWKVDQIIKWSWKISAGNSYLAAHAAEINGNVIINPTTLDTENIHNPDLHPTPARDGITLGWTGTHSTSKYIESLLPALDKLNKRSPFNFIYISNREPNLKADWLEYRKWSPETEVKDLLEIDLGLMPLEDDEWCKGKCGLKLIQYLALGIPAIASPVGVNTSIMEEGINGEFAKDTEGFISKIEFLLRSKNKLRSYQEGARQRMIERYSRISNRSNFLSLFSNGGT